MPSVPWFEFQETKAGDPLRYWLVGDHVAVGIRYGGHCAGEVADFHCAVTGTTKDLFVGVSDEAREVCLCPDYVFVPRELQEAFVGKLVEEFSGFFPEYLSNPNVVSIVNDRNYERVTGLIDDAVAKGATKLTVVNADETAKLPDRSSRRVPPTVLLDVPESARISDEEIFGPVLAVQSLSLGCRLHPLSRPRDDNPKVYEGFTFMHLGCSSSCPFRCKKVHSRCTL